MTIKKAIEKFNEYGRTNTPFLFIINYDQSNFIIEPLQSINSERILFNINNNTNTKDTINTDKPKAVYFSKNPISKTQYQASFKKVMLNIRQGNSYLTNLTCETPVNTNLSLKDIFTHSKANYKLLYKDEWVVFSPETFIKITDNKILSFPMKGTIDAAIPNAKELIINNSKEAAEHATIVDLIRNDLSKISTQVKVDRYRYIDSISTNQGDLLQVSSQISGELPLDFHTQLGNIFFSLLPAGSITGAPKEKTLDIINEAESYNRRFYTGVMGIYDGKNLDSGVMIRFMEKRNDDLYFKSGGGITVNSNLDEEYLEMIRKVYLPF